MTRSTSLLLAMALSAVTMAQTSTVTQVFLPFADVQPLVASVINESADVQTLAIQCVAGTPSDECGIPEPVTVTVGPSTFHIEPNPTGDIWEMLGTIDCKITGTTEAACVATAPLYASGATEMVTTPAESSTTSTVTLNAEDMRFVDVTITAAAVVASETGSSSSVSMTGTGSVALSTGASMASGGSASGSSSSALASASGNVAVAGPGMGSAGVLAALLAVPLLV